MNNERRKKLTNALSFLASASDLLSRAVDEEQDCLDNLPENLQGTERYEKMEDAVSLLESAIENIDEASDKIRDAAV